MICSLAFGASYKIDGTSGAYSAETGRGFELGTEAGSGNAFYYSIRSGEGNFRIAAYSEYVPPPRLGCWPYRSADPVPFAKTDPFGWNVTEYEEDYELSPGLEEIGHQLVKAFVNLGRGNPVRGLPKKRLVDNPYWPAELEKRAGTLAHEHYVTLLPLALSRTQDDKGRLRWTLFGGSERGPAAGFWKSFYKGADQELPAEQGLDFFRRLLHAVVPQEAP